MGIEVLIAVGVALFSWAFAEGQAMDQRASMREALRSMREGSRGHLINLQEPLHEVPLLYGTMKVGINKVYVGASGGNNDYLHIIGNLGEGPIEGLATEDRAYNDPTQVDSLYIDDRRWDEYGSEVVHYEIFTGTHDQSYCSTPHSAIPEWSENKRYTAYLYVRLKYDQNKFQGPPNITAIIKGLKCYDPRTSTTAWTQNPALILRDMLTRPSTRGGMGISTDRIDDTSFNSAANYCDTKGWKANADIRKNTVICDNLILIENTFRGRLIFSETRIELRYMDLNYETPVMTIDEFVDAGGVSSLQLREPNIADVPNCMKAEWISPLQKWQVTPYIFPDTAAIAAEGDYREGYIDLTCCTDFALVQKLVASELERKRRGKEISFTGGRDLARLEPYDVIRVSSTFFGWSEKLFRVQSVEMGHEGNVSVTASEEYSAFYDDTYNMAPEMFYTTNVPSYLDTVPSVQGVSVSEELYVYGGRTFTRLKIDFDPPSNYPWYKHTEIWVKIGDGPYKFISISTSDYILDPVQEGQTYDVRLVNVSIFETKQPAQQAYSVSHYVTGKTSAPSAPASVIAIPTGDTVQIIAPDIDEPDLVGYELRLGSTWDAAVFLAMGNNGQFFLTGFRPGTHTFWVSPKNNRGYYSSAKRSSSCLVLYPAGYTDRATWAWNFSTGEHDGTVHDYIDGQHVLRVSRGNILINGDFGANNDHWTADNATLANEGGGQSGNCMKITATGAPGYACQEQFVKAGRSYDLTYYYKNASGDVFQAGIRDVTNDAWIVAPADKADSTSWSAQQTLNFTAPAGCRKARICFGAKTGGDIVWVDEAQLIDKANSMTGTWTSPEYDWGALVTRRVWGDFNTQIAASNTTWDGVIPAPLTWADVLGAGKRWYELFAPSAAPSLQAKIHYGSVSGALSSFFTNFHFTAPEFNARYVQVEVVITDPVQDAFLNLKTINMKAAFWQ